MMTSLTQAPARTALLALCMAVVVPATATPTPGAIPGPGPRHAALMGEDVFFEIDNEPFLVPLAAIRYSSALRAPIMQFYFDAVIVGVDSPLVQLASVPCRYSFAQAYPATILNRLIGEPEGSSAGEADFTLDQFTAGGTLYGLEAFYADAQHGAGERAHPAAADPSSPSQWEDWFILRDEQRLVRTLIRCATPASQGGRALGIPFCTHYANLDPRHGEKLRLRYPRAYLGAWRVIQAQVEHQLRQFRQRGQAAKATLAQ